MYNTVHKIRYSDSTVKIATLAHNNQGIMESKSVNVVSVSVRRVVGQSSTMETKAPGNQFILMHKK